MNELDALTAVSPIDGRYGPKTLELRALASEFGLIKYRAVVELRWLGFLCRSELIDLPADVRHRTAQALQELEANFDLSSAAAIKEIEARTNHDVKAVEYFIGDWLHTHHDLGRLRPYIHFACTSEDINNLSYGLMMRDIRRQVVEPQLGLLVRRLTDLAHLHAAVPMLARTHGQSASPTTVGKEFAIFAHRLERQRRQLDEVEILGKFSGAVGNFNAHVAAFPEVDWPALSRDFVVSLGLTYNPLTAQIESHDCVSEYVAAVGRANTILIDLCRDVWGYVSLGYFAQKRIADEVGSSTMPHKINPIDFENAEGNLGVANALFEHFSAKLPVSRWQRDLTDSTVLRNLGSAVGYCTIAYQACLKGLDKLEVNEAAIAADLAGAHEVLAEAVQTTMRRYGIADSYERLKDLTRGERIDAGALAAFIDSLELPAETRRALKAMTPASYTGLAANLARSV